MTSATYEDNGIRFDYPADWELEEIGVSDESEAVDEVLTISIQSKSGLAFMIVTLDTTCPAPAEMADQALSAMREEYPTLDSAPSLETIGGHRAVGHDVEFFTMDMTNACAIRCFRTPRRTVLVFGQWSDLDDEEENNEQFERLKQSFHETDGQDQEG